MAVFSVRATMQVLSNFALPTGVTADLSGISCDGRYLPVPKGRKELGEVLCL